MSLVLALNYELIHEQQGNHYQFLTYDILHKVLTCLFYLFIEDIFYYKNLYPIETGSTI